MTQTMLIWYTMWNAATCRAPRARTARACSRTHVTSPLPLLLHNTISIPIPVPARYKCPLENLHPKPPPRPTPLPSSHPVLDALDSRARHLFRPRERLAPLPPTPAPPCGWVGGWVGVSYPVLACSPPPPPPSSRRHRRGAAAIRPQCVCVCVGGGAAGRIRFDMHAQEGNTHTDPPSC